MRPLIMALLVTGGLIQNANAQAAGSETVVEKLKDNPTLAAAIAREEAAGLDIDLARAVKRPQLRGDAEIGYLRETLSLPMPLEPGGPSSFTGDREPIRIGVGVEQLLYDQGVSTSGINIAESKQQAAAFDTQALKQDLYLATATAVLNVRFNLDLVEERELALELSEARMNDITARRNAGLATVTDVSQAKARRALALAELADAKRALRNVQNDLQRLTGDAGLAVNLMVPHSDMLTTSSPRELVETALSNNPTYLAAKARAESSAFAVDQAKGQDGPQIAFVAEAGYARDEHFGLQLGEAEQVGAFIRGTWRFGTGGARTARIQKSRALRQASTLDLDSVRRQLEDDIRSTLADIEAADASFEARELQLEAALIAQEGVALEVETGRRTELDQLDADRAVATARVELRRAETARQVANLNLERLIGAL